jgi:hypothetical protein
MKNGLSYFQDGGEVDVPEQVITPTKIAAPGKAALDPTQTAELLANMQAMIDRRESPMAILSRGMERAAAWGSGGLQGPSAALNQLNQREQNEEKSTFDMRQQMAAFRTAQAQQEAFNQRRAADLGGAPGAAPGGFGEATMPPQIRTALSNARTQEDYNKIYNAWAQKQAEIYARPEMDEPKIPVVDMSSGKPVLRTISAREYRANPGKYQDTPQTQTAVQSTAAAPTAPTTVPSGITIPTSAIRQVESGGNAAAVSPKGAEGTMQVMPATQAAPGFGVAPAANKTPQELERVGGDYFQAMKNKYKDDVTAAIAYNMGPGATDKWIAAGRKFDQLPAETQQYINRLTTQPGVASIPQIRAETMARPTPGAMQRQQEIDLAAQKEFGTNIEKTNAVKAQKIDDAGLSAPEREARFNDIINITNDPEMKKVFGMLATKGFAPFVLKQLEEGINAGQFGTMGVAKLERNLMMAGATPSQIEKMLRVEKHLAKAELEYAQMYLTGQGAVSDNERRLVKDAVGNIKDPFQVMQMQAKVMAQRAEFDRKIKDAYDAYRDRNGDYASFGAFMRSDAKSIVNEHNQKLASIIGKSPSLLTDPISAKGMSSSNYTPGSIKWGNPKK